MTTALLRLAQQHRGHRLRFDIELDKHRPADTIRPARGLVEPSGHQQQLTEAQRVGGDGRRR